MPQKIDITNQKYGRLTVVSFSGRDKHGGRMLLCRCDCGNEITARLGNIRQGRTTSCGCFQKEVVAAHGFKKVTA